MRLSRRSGLAGAAIIAALPTRPRAANGTPPGRLTSATSWQSYADPEALARLPFGSRSHWLQPWRISTGTAPAAALSQAVGAVVEDVTRPDLPVMVETLARHGIRRLRIEIGWGDVDFASESRLLDEARLRPLLLACRRAGVRPLVLLNAHHGRPVPFRLLEVRVLDAAAAGERMVRVDDATGVEPGRTGITDTAAGVMADVLVTRIDHGSLQLSKPLPQPVAAGTKLTLATLRYEPFSAPGSAGNETTLAGWLRYVDVVADFMGAVLEAPGGEDRGFDLEIWNELTFGTHFLSIGNYYDPRPADAPAQEQAIWEDLPMRTAAHVAAQPARFAGVALTNGFASTIPWVASSRQHPRIAALSKHPYPPLRRFPGDEDKRGPALGPDAQPVQFIPSYSAYFPEYAATAIQTETIMRDVSDAPNEIYGLQHGRSARRVDGKVAPVDIWLTEFGVDPLAVGIADRDACERLKTKFHLRGVLFYTAIGVARTYLFNAIGEPTHFGLIDQASPTESTPVLRALNRAIELVCGDERGEPAGPAQPDLTFSIEPSGPLDAPIFAGAGAGGPPPLLGSECVVLLPFRRPSGSMAIVYYIMTRDVRTDWPSTLVRVRIEGLGKVGPVQAFDPVTFEVPRCRVIHHDTPQLLVELEMTDSPRILLVPNEPRPIPPQRVTHDG